jgi:hypothetical protein
MHNFPMTPVLQSLVLSLWLALAALSPLHAQQPADDRGGDSSEVEESDEEYRRRMELEDARQRDLGYTLPAPTYAQKQEKLDKLPEESRDHIRDQLVDIIMEDGEWEPSDALKEYPYEPTAAAMGDPELMQQEQEAWDEQIEKYHKREAAAYGTYLGPVPGPGNPSGGQAGGEAGEGAEGSEQGSGQEGGGAESGTGGDSGAGAEEQAASAATATAGSYAPYQSNRSDSEDEVSTAGAQQSALEFLKAMQGRASASPAAPTAGAAATAVAEAGDEAAAAGAQSDPAEQAAEATDPQEPDSASEAAQSESSDKTVEIDLTTPGLILIEDLEKLEGTGAPDDTEQPD